MDNVKVAIHDHPRTAAAQQNGRSRPDPEVVPKAQRRRFSASYKLKVLEEVDNDSSQVGAILRREGLYSSHLSEWRKQRRQGALDALDKKRGRKGKSAEQSELERLQRDNARLQRELEKARILIDAQKKLAEILGVQLPKIADNGESE
jgi:transposase